MTPLQQRRSQTVSPLRLSLPRVSPQLPTQLFDDDEDIEDNTDEGTEGFQTARSPSELLIKIHEDDEVSPVSPKGHTRLLQLWGRCLSSSSPI